MSALTSRLPEIELLPADAAPRAARSAPPSPWRAPPVPEIERIVAAARPAVRPAPRAAPPSPRRTHWPQPPRRPRARPPAPAPEVAVPVPARAVAPVAAELEIPLFLRLPRPPGPAPAAPATSMAVPVSAPPIAPRRPMRPRWGRIGAAAAIVAGVAALAGITGAGTGPGAPAPSATPASPSAIALAEIPPGYLTLYRRFGRAMDIDWRFLAAIGAQESDHGRDPRAARVNPAGCAGPMQLGVGGRCGDFVGAWGVDGDGDGRIDPLQPADAIATAARGLRLGKGAPPAGGDAAGYRRAACGYFGACSDAGTDYADEVMARAERYGFTG